MSAFIHDPYTRKAMELVRQGKSFFITGKAGTGKTYLLNEIVRVLRSEGRKISVIAPTGVAAKNAGGSTIHSFFNLKSLTYIPGAKIRGYSYKLDFDLARLNAIQELDLLVIDEISMVRCDLLDCIDDQLRHYRNSSLPFGGVQILFFGDFYQLPPVLEDDKTEAEMINGYYDSVYAFHSDVWKLCKFPMLELMTNHRQDGDTTFFNILNKIRVKEETDADLRLLNQKVEKGVLMSSLDNQIKLTSLNRTADNTNRAVLHELRGTEKELPAYIKYYKYGVQTYIDDSEWDGYKLSRDEYPTDRVLKLKVGAKVMFLRNEPGLYSNGTIGIVKKIEQDTISVRTEDNRNVSVGRSTWYFYHDIWDKRNKTYEQYLFATFEQFPLRLAWAVTIHKSQGLTFSNVMIDIRNAFAHGQTYVALSRCKSLDGITLNKEIRHNDIIIDDVVEEFMNSITRIAIPMTYGMNPSSSSVSEFKNTKIYVVMGYKTRSFISDLLDSGKSIQSAFETLKAKKPAAWRNTMNQLLRRYPNADIFEFLHNNGSNLVSNGNDHFSFSTPTKNNTFVNNYTLTEDRKGLKSIEPSVGTLTLGEGIERIEPEACKDCSLLTRVTLPKSLKVIGDSAFQNCSGLRDVHLSDSLEEIGNQAFSGCINLKEIELPSCLAVIGFDAFVKTGLDEINIPLNVSKIGVSPFDCYMSVEEDNDYFDYDKDGILYSADLKILHRCPINVENDKVFMYDNVTTIKSYAFERCTANSIVLPSNIETIEKSAFVYCKNLEMITIPVNVTKIEKNAFQGCENLKIIRFNSHNLDSIVFDDDAFANINNLAKYIEVRFDQLDSVSHIAAFKYFNFKRGIEGTEPFGYNVDKTLDALFPMYDIYLGKVVGPTLESKGYESNYDFKARIRSFSYKGITAYMKDKASPVSKISIHKSATLPDKLTNINFSLDLSISQIITLFSKWGFNIKDNLKYEKYTIKGNIFASTRDNSFLLVISYDSPCVTKNFKLKGNTLKSINMYIHPTKSGNEEWINSIKFRNGYISVYEYWQK